MLFNRKNKRKKTNDSLGKKRGLYYRRNRLRLNYEYEANCCSVWVAEGHYSNVAPGVRERDMLFNRKSKRKKTNDTLGKKRGPLLQEESPSAQ